MLSMHAATAQQMFHSWYFLAQLGRQLHSPLFTVTSTFYLHRKFENGKFHNLCAGSDKEFPSHVLGSALLLL